MVMKIKISLLAVLALMGATLLTGCSKSESADASDLLGAVPSDASMVAVTNLNAMLEKAGCKIDGSKVKPSEALTGAVNRIDDKTLNALANDFINGTSGIEPSVAVLFSEGYQIYFSAIAADPDAFKASVEKATGSKFSTSDGVDICGNTALKGNQFWVNLGRHDFDPQNAKHFSSLSKDQSFLSNKASERLVKIEKDIEGWGSIGGVLNTSSLDFQQKAMAQVFMQTLFEDPSNFSFAVNFEKGQLVASAQLLNSKGEPAKYNFPTTAVDVKTIESVGGSAYALLAISIPQKLVKQLQKDADSKKPSMLGMILPSLESVDGTLALAYDGTGNNMRGVITTTGQNTGALIQLLESTGLACKIDGKLVTFSKGNLQGNQKVADMAGYLKDAVAGVTTASPEEAPDALKNSFESGAFTLVPEKGGITMRMLMLSPDKDRNFIITLLNSAK